MLSVQYSAIGCWHYSMPINCNKISKKAVIIEKITDSTDCNLWVKTIHWVKPAGPAKPELLNLMLLMSGPAGTPAETANILQFKQ